MSLGCRRLSGRPGSSPGCGLALSRRVADSPRGGTGLSRALLRSWWTLCPETRSFLGNSARVARGAPSASLQGEGVLPDEAWGEAAAARGGGGAAASPPVVTYREVGPPASRLLSALPPRDCACAGLHLTRVQQKAAVPCSLQRCRAGAPPGAQQGPMAPWYVHACALACAHVFPDRVP